MDIKADVFPHVSWYKGGWKDEFPYFTSTYWMRIVKSKEVNDRWRNKNSMDALYWENHTELIINENISLDSIL